MKWFAVPALLLAMIPAAFAQTAAPADKGCAGGTGGGPNQNLSKDLQGSGGVICPPNVDPGIKAPTPQTGDTPVIPPPHPGVAPK